MSRLRLILVGGGLANGLLALKLLQTRPAVDFLVLEGGPALGGVHTWSFHDADLSPAGHRLVAPLVVKRWNGQQVVFPALRRRFPAGYNSVSAERFSDHLTPLLGDRLPGPLLTLRCNARVAEIAPTRVRLETGETLAADAVIDGRGFRASPHAVIRFQSFVGREMRFAAPHGVDVPIIMDATTPQDRGYRFTYVLPFSADTALVEDTGYLDEGELDESEMDGRIEAYCRAKGWRATETLRRETGVLPITLSGDVERFWNETRDVPAVGLAGGFFHPTTGYSLPDAVRVAELIAAMPSFEHAQVHAALRDHAKRLWKERALYRGLNRMLFLAGHPERRWRVMQRFYGLSEGLIVRFYADRLTAADKLRILVGKPPVSMIEAVAALLSNGRERKAF